MATVNNPNYVRSKLICMRRLVIYSSSHLLPTSAELDLTIVLVSDSMVSRVITGMTHIYVPAHIPTVNTAVICNMNTILTFLLNLNSVQGYKGSYQENSKLT